MKTPGYLVQLKDGRKGRTYHDKGLINGKVPVYLCTKTKPTRIKGLEVCIDFTATAILCAPETLQQIGFID